MIQGGDPGTKGRDRSKYGTGGPGYTLRAEFNHRPHLRGTFSMARRGPALGIAGSRFSQCVSSAPSLNGTYPVFGKVESGMEVVDRTVRLPRDGRNMPGERVEINVRILEK